MCSLVDRCRTRAVGAEQRKEKANDVKQAAALLLQRWKVDEAHSHGATWYMHACYHHLPDQIESLPCDIIQASGDSFEAKNQQMKQILRRFDSNLRQYTACARKKSRN